MRHLAAVLLALWLPWLCTATDNGLDQDQNVEIDPLYGLVLSPGELLCDFDNVHNES